MAPAIDCTSMSPRFSNARPCVQERLAERAERDAGLRRAQARDAVDVEHPVHALEREQGPAGQHRVGEGVPGAGHPDLLGSRTTRLGHLVHASRGAPNVAGVQAWSPAQLRHYSGQFDDSTNAAGNISTRSDVARPLGEGAEPEEDHCSPPPRSASLPRRPIARSALRRRWRTRTPAASTPRSNKGAKPSHETIETALVALEKMLHRAGNVDGEGDGCGVLIDIPRKIWAEEVRAGGHASQLALDAQLRGRAPVHPAQGRRRRAGPGAGARPDEQGRPARAGRARERGRLLRARARTRARRSRSSGRSAA